MSLAATELQSLPDPTIIESLDYEALLAEIKADILRFAPELEEALALASEPVAKIAQAIAYRILHERQHANDQALSLMLAKAQDSQLDHLGSLPFINTSRKTLSAADSQAVPPLPTVRESDDDYRQRLHIALEGYSTAGPIGAYVYHGLAAHEAVKDIAVDAPTFSRWPIPEQYPDNLPEDAIVLIPDYTADLDNPLPGDVAVTVLSHSDTSDTASNGAPSDQVIAAVNSALNHEAVRPLTDRVRCRPADIVPYPIEANLWFYPGPDSDLVLQQAQAKAQTYAQERQRIGEAITLSALHAAIHCPGVQKVELLSPTADLVIASHQAAHCTEIVLHNQGVAV